jgi:hypothetical protein
MEKKTSNINAGGNNRSSIKLYVSDGAAFHIHSFFFILVVEQSHSQFLVDVTYIIR